MAQDSGAETMLLIQHDSGSRDQAAAMARTLAAIEKQEVSECPGGVCMMCVCCGVLWCAAVCDVVCVL